jgi:D-glycero-alpha-D-manno-heptose 1-phosphate guanylyltransferase
MAEREATLSPDRVPVFVLAGGEGRRLRPAWSGPKVLVPVGESTLLEIHLEALERAGFRRVVLLTGRGGDQVEDRVAAWEAQRAAPLQVTCLREPRPLGTGGALRAASPLAGDWNLVLNGDSYCRLPWDRLLREGPGLGCPLVVVVSEMPEAADFGRVETDADGRIRRFAEKGVSGPGLVNAGVYLARRDFLLRILAEDERPDPLSLEEQVLPEMAAGGRLGAWRTATRFWDIGRPERLEAFRRAWERGELG